MSRAGQRALRREGPHVALTLEVRLVWFHPSGVLPSTLFHPPVTAPSTTSAREVDPGVIAAADAMGATRREIVAKVMLREARPGLVSGLTVTVIALIGYTAMAGTVGGGGLGNLAVGYGYERFETPQE